jgi:Metallo-peptidase family M12
MKYKQLLIMVCAFLLSACQQFHVPVQTNNLTAGYPLPYGVTTPLISKAAATPSTGGVQNEIEEDYLMPPPRTKQVGVAKKETSAFVSNISQARLTAYIAVEVDYDLYVLLGSNETTARNYVANLFDAVSNVYRRDANIEIKPSFVRVWTTPADPWSSSTTVDTLYELQTYWNNYESTRSRAAVVLLSSRSLGGGIAYFGSVCQKTGAYDTAVTGSLTGVVNNVSNSNTWDVVVVAHELGHIFGTGHTHCTPNSAGTAYYDRCYGSDRYTPPSSCYQGATVNSYGTIMSYCHTNYLPEVGMRNIKPLSFLNSAEDPKIKNIIRGTAEQYTVGNDAEGCLIPSWALNPTFTVPIIDLLTN